MAQFRVVLNKETGAVDIFADDGTFVQGKEKIEFLFKVLQAGGVKVQDVSPVEQHRHDHEGVEAGHVHSHGGGH